MQADDARLVARLRAGDQAAFATVVRQWSPAMLRVARVHVRTHASAEEVVQEAWFAVVRGLDGFEGRAQLRTWVFRILVNVARRRGRTENRMNAELSGPTVDPGRFRDDDDPYPGHWRADAAPADWGPSPCCSPLSSVLCWRRRSPSSPSVNGPWSSSATCTGSTARRCASCWN